MQHLIRGDRFEVIGRLGSGTQGEVYRARDRHRDLDVAIKVIPALESRAVLELKHEFRVAAALSHPHLVRLHELFAGDQGCFFTMELVDGETFAESAARAAPRELRRLAGDLAEAVHALHEARRLHRDIKPANLMVSATRGLVVLDFGFASPRRVQVGDGIGTPAYLAPELLWGAEPSTASDWFSVGAVLWEASTRTPLRRDVSGHPILDGKAPDPALDDLLRRLLAPDPTDRPDGESVLFFLDRPPRSAELIPSVGEEVTAAEIVGRDAEIERLRGLHAASSRAARVVRVVGPSGIGKTATVLGALEALGPDVPVHRGRCGPREDIRFNALDELMDGAARRMIESGERLTAHIPPALAAALCALFPIFSDPGSERADDLPADGETVLRQAVRGFLRLVETGSAETPVVFLDDLHWADRDSVRFLSVLLEEARAARVFIVLASRSELRELDDITAVEDVTLRPLSSLNALRLAEAWIGPGSDAARAAARQCEGSPLFLRQIADQMATGAAAHRFPESVDGAIRSAVGGLPAPARRLAQFLCVVGRPVAAELASRGAECDPCDVFFLHDHRLLRSDPGPRGVEIGIYHDSIREVLHLDMSAELRSALHLRAAKLLGADEAKPEEVVFHYVEAGRPADGERLASAAAAAAASSFAFNRAADLYGLVLEISGDRRDSLALREKRADALSSAGRCAEAAHAYLDAAERASGSHATELRRKASEQLLRVGRVDEGLSVLGDVLRELRLPNPKGWAATLAWMGWMRALRALMPEVPDSKRSDPRTLQRADACFSAGLGLNMLDVRRSMLFQSVQLYLARRSGDELRISRALAVESTYTSTRGARGSDARAHRLVARAKAVAERSGDPLALAFADLCAGVGRTVEGNFRGAIPLLDAARERYLTHQDGVTWEVANCHLYKCWSSVYLGEIGRVRRLVARHRREAEHRGDVLAQLGLTSGTCVVADLAAGKPDETEARARRARASLPREGFNNLDYFDLVTHTTIALYRGDGARASALVRAAWPRLQRGLFLNLRFFRAELRFLRGRAALAHALEVEGGRRERLLADARKQLALLKRESFPFATALGAGLHAELLALEAPADARPHLAAELPHLWEHCPLLALLFEDVLAGGGTLHDVAQADAFLRIWMPVSAALLRRDSFQEPRLPLHQSLRRPVGPTALEQR